MQLKTSLSSYKNKLFSVNHEPLTNTSKVFLGIFILFCFIMISEALNQQRQIIEKPYSKFSHKCIELTKSENNKMHIYDFKYSLFGSSSDIRCNKIDNLYKSLFDTFKYKIEKIKTFSHEKQILNQKIKDINNQYSNMLLEKIANQPQNKSPLKSNTNTVKNQLNNYTNQINALKVKIANMENIYQDSSYIEIISSIKKNAHSINNDFNQYQRLYHLKVLFSIYLFLIPLFLIVYLIYNFTIKKEKYIISHLLINLLNVVAIFGLFYLLDFIYSIIPKVIFIKIYEILVLLNIVAFANYIAIAFFIIIFGVIIKYIQKRALNQKNIKDTQLSNTYIKQGLCHKCGACKDDKNKYCPSCGESLYYECKSCNKSRIVESSFCQECGEV